MQTHAKHLITHTKSPDLYANRPSATALVCAGDNMTDRCSTCLNSSPNTKTGGVYVSVVVCVCVRGLYVCVCGWLHRVCGCMYCMFQRSSGRWHHFIVCFCSRPSRLPAPLSFPLLFLTFSAPSFLLFLKKCNS